MKRMYVVLTIMIALIFGMGVLLAQQGSKPVDQETDLMQRRMKMREEMHRRMMDKLINGAGPDQDMFKDMEQYLDGMMTDSFSGFDTLMKPRTQSYKMEWSESTSGRTLNLTPKTPEQQLDINVSNGLIIIKGKAEEKTSNGVSVSNFTNSFSVPDDCDAGKVKISQSNGKILVTFPYRTTKPAQINPKQDLKPIPPSKNDVQI